ncbi:MAG: phenylacetate--CoA ligase family protein [Opitutales bacterium]
MTKGAGQLERLNTLLGALYPGNGFYRQQIEAAGLTEGARSLDHFRTAFPFTTKEALSQDQRTHPPYGTARTYPLEHYTRFHRTSGTTGRPLYWLDTPDSWQWTLENWACVLREAGATAGTVALFAFSFGPFLGFWSAFEAALQVGLRCLPGGGLSTRLRLELVRDHGVELLCCTPTYALHLAETASQEGIDLRGCALRTIVVGGEPGGSSPALRARLLELLPQVRLFDHHGMTEVGPVSYEDPAHPGRLRLLEDRYLIEVIDPEKATAVEPGQVGELVLTNLGRTACPLLRYRTGDLVQPVLLDDGGWDEAALALDGGILGRVDDMVVVRGVNLYPSAVDEVMRGVPGTGEYQVCLSRHGTMAELALRVEPREANPAARNLAEQVQAALRDAFALRIQVDVVEPGSLPRFEMKARRWVEA